MSAHCAALHKLLLHRLLVQVAITCTNTEKAPYWHAINQLQLTKITEYLPYLATVDANGLALQVGLYIEAQEHDYYCSPMCTLLSAVVST